MYADMGSANISEMNMSSTIVTDFRSDTVTRPSQEMRAMMAKASVGDDVYGDDPTVATLERKVADLLGKEAGLFVSSGTQSNLISLLTHCGRGEEYISGSNYHVAYYEAGGAAVLGGISPCHLPVGDQGELSLEAVKAAIKQDDIHHAVTRLVSLENTVYGRVQDQMIIDSIADMAHKNGLKVHLDGARLMNAVVKSNARVADLVKNADTVSLCLSKGLGAPIGSVLVGPEDFIKKARRNRKMLGGGMRQAGVLAACGLYALENNVTRLADDHRRARLLADMLSSFDAFHVDEGRLDTNMIFVDVDQEQDTQLREHLKERGILFGAPGKTTRLVTHLDIDDDDIQRLETALFDYFNR